MNWTDIAVLVIILGFTVIGVKNGFLYSVFRLVSYILSVIFAIKFYPLLSAMLQKTIVYTSIKTAVVNSIIKQQSESVSAIKQNSAQAIVDTLKLPGFLKDSLIKKITEAEIFDISKIIDSIGAEIATMVINILSVILIYLMIRFGLIFAKVIIKTIARIPVFKQLDKTGGLVLGAIEGIFVVYILCAVIILFSAFPKFAATIDSIEQSQFASYFYENNFIVSWMQQ